MNELDAKRVSFSVDAGIVQRLGFELVGRAETAVAELIKNSYDADAQIVDVCFQDVTTPGGTLTIHDDGTGMNESQLVNGFLRLSSSTKVHAPYSPKYNRVRAGKKGIGRFATQRLGHCLEIITEVENAPFACKVVIDWDVFEMDQELGSIEFPLTKIPPSGRPGTTLIIIGLRESWGDKGIDRVSRYVASLFQPSYLSENAREKKLATQSDGTFVVNFSKKEGSGLVKFNNAQNDLFANALALIEGFVDKDHKGALSICSNYLPIDDVVQIPNSKTQTAFTDLKDVSFKIAYYIYGRPDYYANKVSKSALKTVQDLSSTISGVRLYRNGFRVLPYGEITDDWVEIDRRWSSQSGVVNIPLSNKNIFGFVEINDVEEPIFEETSSREGLIENNAFKELTSFIHNCLITARTRIAEEITILRNRIKEQNDDFTKEDDGQVLKALSNIDLIKKLITDSERSGRLTNSQAAGLNYWMEDLVSENTRLRILANLGLSIGEFSHEINQRESQISGKLFLLRRSLANEKDIQLLDVLENQFKSLMSYSSIFRTIISSNTSRSMLGVKTTNINRVVQGFAKSMEANGKLSNIEITVQTNGYIESSSIQDYQLDSVLVNLYSNSKKAIIRSSCAKGTILIETGKRNGKIFIRFSDNGDGIPDNLYERVFNAFFTTSNPVDRDESYTDSLTGMGLGLSIVKDILANGGNSISVIPPINGFSTTFEIILI